MSKAKSKGIGCLTVVGIVLITLKVVGVQPVASWSWLAVLSPFWGPWALVFFLLMILIATGDGK